MSCHRTLVHTISYARVRFWRTVNLVFVYLHALYWFQKTSYILCHLLIDCRQNYLHVAYSHLPIVLKYRTDLLYSGYLGFGGVNLEHLPATTCIYSQNVSTANKHWIWGGLWLCWCILSNLVKIGLHVLQIYNLSMRKLNNNQLNQLYSDSALY